VLLTPVLVPVAVLDFSLDGVFVDHAGSAPSPVIAPSDAYPLWLASMVCMILPLLVNVWFVGKTLKQELGHNPPLAAWFKRNTTVASLIVVVALTHPESLLLLSSQLAASLDAPWSPAALASIQTSGLYANLLEDLPQLVVQALFASKSNGTTPFSSKLSMYLSGAMLVAGVSKRCLLRASASALAKGGDVENSQVNLEELVVSADAKARL